MQIVDTHQGNCWKFNRLITDLPLDSPNSPMTPAVLDITGDMVSVYLGNLAFSAYNRQQKAKATFQAKVSFQFSTSEIQDVVSQEGSPSIGSAVLFGILGGLVGGNMYVVVKLNNGCSLAFTSGKRTNKTRQRSAKIAGEIKQAARILELQAKDRSVQTPEAISDTKECPYCTETIKAKAVKCRYCGSDLVEQD